MNSMRLLIYVSIFFLFYSCNNNPNASADALVVENTDFLKAGDVLDENPKASIDFLKSSDVLDENIYWQIIHNSFGSKTENFDVLQEELLKLSPRDIIGFQLRTQKLLTDSYRSHLWCGAYIMNGGCSDDGFEYFRLWLISQGKNTFYEALSNPDCLVSYNKHFVFELEPLLYAPYDAFRIKTSKEIYDYTDYEKIGSYPEIEFNWNDNDPNSMKLLCPKLYAKYME